MTLLMVSLAEGAAICLGRTSSESFAFTFRDLLEQQGQGPLRYPGGMGNSGGGAAATFDPIRRSWRSGRLGRQESRTRSLGPWAAYA